VADHRTLLDFLSDLPPLQGKYHITGPFKKALFLFPAQAALALLQASKRFRGPLTVRFSRFGDLDW